MKRWLKLGAFALIPACFAGELKQDEILNKLQELQERIQKQEQVINQQQSVIGELKGVVDQLQTEVRDQPVAPVETVTEIVRQEVDAAIEEKGFAQLKDTPLLTLGKAIDGVTLKSDLRVRYERREIDMRPGRGDRDRLRVRFRPGLVWENSAENFEIGAGLATGMAAATSTDDSWGDVGFFETGDIRLDYAYAKHTMGDVAVTAGQQHNPFVMSWVMWDTDVRPTGFTAAYKKSGAFATIGAYDMLQYPDAGGTDLAMLYAGQVGYAHEGDGANVTVAAAIHHYNGEFDKKNRPNMSYEYDIVDLYGSVGIPIGESAEVGVFGETWINVGADGMAGTSQIPGMLDPDDENQGWVAGISAKSGPAKVSWSYTEVGADSSVPGLNDGDLSGGGINAGGIGAADLKAHKVSASYKISKSFSLGGTAYFMSADERPDMNKSKLYQVDMKYKF